MSYILGIDTGGTYTDGVIFHEQSGTVLSKGKALTTRENLVVGIENCLEMLDKSYFHRLKQVNLSTTLATNAIVENRGNKIALFCLGDRPEGSLPAEYTFDIRGKYDIRGRQVEPLHEKDVVAAVKQIRDKVGAVAISGFASIRNNLHEIQAKKAIQKYSGLPVVCAHEMSSQLGYFDRTVTTALNARLLSVIYELLTAVKKVLRKNKLEIPLMVVTGRGSLVYEKVALERPIETVLSGPAASISGAVYLSGKRDGLILDMGGTTTDIALVENGKVKRNEMGANVGGYHLHIEAAEIYTYGMGGDSRIYLGKEGQLVVGPNKIFPVCRAVQYYPYFLNEMREVLPSIYRQRDQKHLLDGFMVHLKENATDLDSIKENILEFLKNGPHTLYKIKENAGEYFRMEDIEDLENKGIVMRIGFTPTDLLHAEDSFSVWDKEAAVCYARELARQYGMNMRQFIIHCRKVIEEKLAYCCKNSKNRPDVSVIGVGAPCEAWLPGMADILKQELCLPQHYDVANALGAAVASVSESAKALIRYNSVLGVYMVFLPDGRREFDDMEQARIFAVENIKKYVLTRADASGCANAKVIISEHCMETENTFIEYEILATAEGKSKWIS